MSAVISPCGTYRYRLERKVTGHPRNTTATLTAVVIMVNPSTADATVDDATIRKLRGFAQRNGWGRIIVGNLFAYRATDVRGLARTTDPVGPENDVHLRNMIAEADELVFAWGPLAKQPKGLRARWRAIHSMARRFELQPMSIGPPAKDGHPCHPLMLPYERQLQPWEPSL
jgi:hypothetical protein